MRARARLLVANPRSRRAAAGAALTHDLDLRVTEPCFLATAHGSARPFGHDEVVALLEPLAPPT